MRFAGAVVIFAGLVGCTPYLQATAGYASPLADKASGERGGALNLHAGFDLLDDNGPYALAIGTNVRTRFTERTQQAALGHEATLRYFLHRYPEEPTWVPCVVAIPGESCRVAEYPWLTPMELYLRLGASVVTLGARDGDFAVGTTAFAEYGLVMMLGGEDVPYVTLGTALGYDARLEGEPGPWTVSFLVGVGLLKARPRATGGGLFFGR